MNEIEIVVTSKDQTGPGFDSARGRADGLRNSIGQVATTAAGFLSANVFGGLADQAMSFFTGSTRAASDLNEAANRSATVFGSSAEAIGSFAQNAAQNFGLSESAALSAAGTFGNMFDQLGIGEPQSSSLSQQMIALASDLGSFHNADITSVIEAQTAAFRGEYDALQQFIPTIDAAAVQQRAMADTGKTSADQLSEQEKALVTYQLMLEGAGDAQGDFARTADDQANAERIAAAEMENSQAAIGQKLLPVTKALTDAKLKLASLLVDTVIPAFEALGRWVSDNKELLMAIGIGIAATLVPAFIAWAVAAGAAAVATLLAAAPLILIGAAVAALAYLVITHWDTIRSATEAVFSAVVGFVQSAISWIADNWPLLLAILTGPIGLAVLAITTHWDTIKSGVTAVKDWIVERFGELVGFVTGIPGTLASAAAGMWDWLTTGLLAAANWVIDRLNDVLDAIDRAAGPVVNFPSIPHIGGSAPRGDVDRDGRSAVHGRFAHGGVASGLVMVGEQGRELVDLPGGSRVYSNPDTEQMMAGSGGGAAKVVLELRSSGTGLDDVLVEVLRKAIRVQGGNVQLVLGRN